VRCSGRSPAARTFADRFDFFRDPDVDATSAVASEFPQRRQNFRTGSFPSPH
jgi:hypothetical protein